MECVMFVGNVNEKLKKENKNLFEIFLFGF